MGQCATGSAGPARKVGGRARRPAGRGAAACSDTGSDGMRASSEAGVPGASAATHPSAPVGEVLREARVRPSFARGCGCAAGIGQAGPPTELRERAAAWARDRRPASRDRQARRVNPVTSPPLARIGRSIASCPTSSTSPLLTQPLNFRQPAGDVGLDDDRLARGACDAGRGPARPVTGADEVPRLIQAAPNTDFEVEVNWDSAPSEGYHLQGIIVQQDSDNVLRIETHHDGFGPGCSWRASPEARLRAPLQQPQRRRAEYMRLQRAGSSWTIHTSTTGRPGHRRHVQRRPRCERIGPFASNSSGGWAPPAYTSRIDHFARSHRSQWTKSRRDQRRHEHAERVGAEVRWQTDELRLPRSPMGEHFLHGRTVGQQAHATTTPSHCPDWLAASSTTSSALARRAGERGRIGMRPSRRRRAHRASCRTSSTGRA